MSMGLMAGVFLLYAHTIMPGLRKTDDRTFIRAFQAIDSAIINPWFMLTSFGGALVFTIAAALTHIGRPDQWAIYAALGLYAVTVVVTAAVHLPRNDALKRTGDPGDVAGRAFVRKRFGEARWAAWNLLRVLCTTAAFALLVVASL